MALPTPTAASATLRYIPAGVRRISWVPTIATQASPSTAELTAGTDLTFEVAEIAGFTSTSGSVDVGDYGSTFVSKIPGLQTADDSSLKVYLSTNATDLRSVLTEATSGYIVIYPEGIVASGKCSVFKVRIGSSSVDEVPPGDPATLTVMFYITVKPTLNIAIPTA